MILVIMLNFLISVINDTYVKVMSRAKMYTYRYRNELNIEFLELRDHIMTPFKINCMLLINSNTLYQNEADQLEDIKFEITQIIKEN